MGNRKSGILTHIRPTIDRFKRHRLALAGFSGVAILGMATAVALVPGGDEPPVSTRTVLENLAIHDLRPLERHPAEYLREERIQRSDTLASLLSRLGVDDPEALEFMRQREETRAIARQLRPGKTVTARTNDAGKLLALYFPLNGKDSMLVVEASGRSFSAAEQSMKLEAQTVFRSGEIRSSLFGATDAAGIPDAIAVQLAEIFSGEVDFYRDLRKGDQFTLVYELLSYRGQPVRSGKILAAEFINNQKRFTAFWFETEAGKGGYYTSDGKNLRKAFLRAPLEFSRMTSGFSSARRHPVLNVVRAHKGIDYAAPIGTRVRSIADGTVEFAGRQGGYGNFVVVRHQGAYSTAYGHLNGFGPGIKAGTRISQGQTVGYVGQTGLATGPHLHYEFRVNARQVNPMALTLPDAPPLLPVQLASFRSATEGLRAELAFASQQTNLAVLE